MKNLKTMIGGVAAGLAVSIAAAYAAGPGDLGAATMSVGVTADGQVLKSSGAIAVKVLSPANYNVEFGRDVTACSFTATPTSAPFFTIVASNRGPQFPTSVYVGTYNTQTKTYAATGFHLIVHCGR